MHLEQKKFYSSPLSLSFSVASSKRSCNLWFVIRTCSAFFMKRCAPVLPRCLSGIRSINSMIDPKSFSFKISCAASCKRVSATRKTIFQPSIINASQMRVTKSKEKVLIKIVMNHLVAYM